MIQLTIPEERKNSGGKWVKDDRSLGIYRKIEAGFGICVYICAIYV